MKAFFIAFNKTLSDRQLSARQRSLAHLLRKANVEFKSVPAGQDVGATARRLAGEPREIPQELARI